MARTTVHEVGERVARVEALMERTALDISDIKRLLEEQNSRIRQLETQRVWVSGLASGLGFVAGLVGSKIKGLL